jgi:hypothetical protein
MATKTAADPLSLASFTLGLKSGLTKSQMSSMAELISSVRGIKRKEDKRTSFFQAGQEMGNSMIRRRIKLKNSSFMASSFLKAEYRPQRE